MESKKINLTELKKTITKTNPGWHLKAKFDDVHGNNWSHGKILVKCTDFDDKFIDDLTIQKEEEEFPVVEVKKNNSELDELKKMFQEQQKTIELLTKKVTLNDGGSKKNVIFEEKKPTFGMPLEMNVTEEDILEEKTYFVNARFYTLGSYKNRNNINITSPTGESIIFSRRSPDRVSSGNVEDILHFASYSTKIRQIQEFIEECPLFNIKIFASYNGVIKSTAMDVLAAENISTAVQSYTPEKIMLEAKRYGIKIDQPIPHIKQELAIIKVNEHIQSKEKEKYNHSAEMNKSIFGG